jgi:hypothetical protein
MTRTAKDLSSIALREFEAHVAPPEDEGADKPVARADTDTYIPRSVLVGIRRFQTQKFQAVRGRYDLFGTLEPQSSVAVKNALRAQVPFMSLIVGRYGVGKTEAVRQFCRHWLETRREHCGDRSWPVPISLARCRTRIDMLNYVPKPLEFVGLLLEGLEFNAGEEVEFEPVLQTGVASGDIYLMLDGLDELVESHSQHENFFTALELLLSQGDASQSRCIVTVRQEYLEAFDPVCRMMLKPFLLSKTKTYCYRLELDSFNDTEIEAYLRKRLGKERSQAMLNRLTSQEKQELRIILYRPLHLRVFCDLAGNDADIVSLLNVSASREGGSLKEPSGVAGLFNQYVSEVSERAAERQELLGYTYKWDNDKLSIEAREIFKRGEDHLTLKAVERIRVPIDPAKEPPEDNTMRAIHKCPFLIRDHSDRKARFSQKAFFEFFVARGIVIEYEQVNQDISRANAFNMLVVNPDMRKFLRGMVRDFDGLIRYSCGLDPDGPSEWSLELSPDQREHLARVLVSVTRGMTDPEREQSGVEDNIRAFLALALADFDPGYLRYCFEAVATYLVIDGRRHKSDWKEPWGRLSSALEMALRDALGRVNSQDVARRPTELLWRWQLLIERCLDLGLRHNFAWCRNYFAEASRILKDVAWEPDSKTRMTHLLRALGERHILF